VVEGVVLRSSGRGGERENGQAEGQGGGVHDRFFVGVQPKPWARAFVLFLLSLLGHHHLFGRG